MTRQTVQVSVIITFHTEGIIAHKTLENIFDMVSRLKEDKMSYEIIAHIDNGDAATKNVVRGYSDKCVIFENNFGDPSLSRNFCINNSKGEYLVIIDGDDITSPDWIRDGIRLLKDTNEPLILHTEADLTFGLNLDTPRLWVMKDSFEDLEDWLIMFGRNRWSSGTILSKKIAKKYQYLPSSAGFGYEDWTFNMATRGHKVKHLVVPGSTRFVRVKEESVYKDHLSENTLTRFVDVYSFESTKDKIRELSLPDVVESPFCKEALSRKRKIIKYTYKGLCQVPVIRNVVQKRLLKINSNIIESKRRAIPSFVFDAIEYANYIDNDIYLDDARLQKLVFYESEYNYLGLAYCKIVEQITQKPSYIIMPPRLNIGGTEKVIVNYLNCLKKISPKTHVVVLSSLPEKNPYNIPDNVDFVDFYGLTENLMDHEREFLLSRLIIEMEAKTLHVLHDYSMFGWIYKHRKLLQDQNYSIFVTHFMYEYTAEKKLKIGFADPYISSIYPIVNKIFTDNSYTANELIRRNHFEKEKISIHYQPIDTRMRKPKKCFGEKFRIIWSGRISPQKRPDILREIAKKLDPNVFQIDVYGRFQPPFNEKYFKGIKSLRYMGTYNGIRDIDIDAYDMALYTSQTDGLPNVLLEMVMLGLPAVASDEGGICDVISSKKYLAEVEDAEQYVEKIKWVKDNYTEAISDYKNMQAVVAKRHTFENLLNTIKKDLKNFNDQS